MRTREEIEADKSTLEPTCFLQLEVLLDIRDMLQEALSYDK